jgi:hypothetical protein
MRGKTMGTKASSTPKQAWFAFDRRDWLAFDRGDYLATKIVLGITALGSVLLGLGGLVVDAVTNAPLPVSYLATAPDAITLPRGATIKGPVTMELLLQDATVGERLTQAIPGALQLTMTIAVLWLLFQLLRSIQAAQPFTRGNVRRINAIALIVGFGGLLGQLAQGVSDNMIQTTGRVPATSSLSFVFSFTPLPIVMMLVIALVGEAFRRGIVLREDVEGLV